MYRVLDGAKEVRERRNIARHPVYRKPELLARGPNQVWSWDITKLRTFTKGSFLSLYVLLDIFSRLVVGWLLSQHESEASARLLIAESFRKHGVSAHQLTIHADRGSPMKAKGLAQLLADLDVTKSHSRPHVSNDNPFSEAQFKTLKYRHDFPDRFGSVEDGRTFLAPFFHWYNHEHHHSGIGLITPADLHYGRADEILARRQRTLDAAFAAHPERFVRKRPSPPAIPVEVWINPPPRPNADRHEKAEVLPCISTL
jgi:transposase InsO family protein